MGTFYRRMQPSVSEDSVSCSLEFLPVALTLLFPRNFVLWTLDTLSLQMVNATPVYHLQCEMYYGYECDIVDTSHVLLQKLLTCKPAVITSSKLLKIAADIYMSLISGGSIYSQVSAWGPTRVPRWQVVVQTKPCKWYISLSSIS